MACAYRGELLGLLAIHLILLSVNAVYPLEGTAVIYSDCLGALGRVRDLPLFQILTRCKHSYILKTILVNRILRNVAYMRPLKLQASLRAHDIMRK